MRETKKDELPVVGREYEYLGQPVKVIRVVPCEGGSAGDAHVEFETRFAECSSCNASELTPWGKA